VAAVRVMVAIGISPSTERLLNRAVKLAEGLDGTLYALHVQRPGAHTTLYRANVEWYLQQARSFGAHVEVVSAHDIAGALVAFARKHAVTHLVIGQSDISRWQEIRHGSIINRILRYRSGIDLYIVTDPHP
jgi:two-component system, OmpR family, sensor histidine kinase KdpD